MKTIVIKIYFDIYHMASEIDFNEIYNLVKSWDLQEFLIDPIPNPVPDQMSENIQFNPFLDLRINDVYATVVHLVALEYIDINNLKGSKIDFGCGEGASTYVLKQYGSNLTALEIFPAFAESGIDVGTLSPEDTHVGDGFVYLDNLAETSPESVDLVSAFRITANFPIGKLYNCAQKVLKVGGQMLVTGQSDAEEVLEAFSFLGKLVYNISEDCLIYTKTEDTRDHFLSGHLASSTFYPTDTASFLKVADVPINYKIDIGKLTSSYTGAKTEPVYTGIENELIKYV